VRTLQTFFGYSLFFSSAAAAAAAEVSSWDCKIDDTPEPESSREMMNLRKFGFSSVSHEIGDTEMQKRATSDVVDFVHLAGAKSPFRMQVLALFAHPCRGCA